MQTFRVPEMSCAHCVQAIARAVQAVDPSARVDADLAAGMVRIASTADSAQLSAAIADAGYANTVRG